jgi:hypothetical protein
MKCTHCLGYGCTRCLHVGAIPTRPPVLACPVCRLAWHRCACGAVAEPEKPTAKKTTKKKGI